MEQGEESPSDGVGGVQQPPVAMANGLVNHSGVHHPKASDSPDQVAEPNHHSYHTKEEGETHAPANDRAGNKSSSTTASKHSSPTAEEVQQVTVAQPTLRGMAQTGPPPAAGPPPAVVGIPLPLHAQDDSDDLPVDFRMQLKLYHMMGEHQRELQRQSEAFHDHQQHMQQQLSRIERILLRHEDHVQHHTEKHATSIRMDLDSHIKNVGEMHQVTKDMLDKVLSKHGSGLMFPLEKGYSFEAQQTVPEDEEVIYIEASKNNGAGGSPKASNGHGKVAVSEVLPSFCSHDNRQAALTWMQRLVGEVVRGVGTTTGITREGWLKIFDLFCGGIISANAMTIGVSANMNIVYALDNIGEPPMEEGPLMRFLGYFFITFYVFELIVKMVLQGVSAFLTGDEWRWNIFDVLLVILGVYENVVDIFGGSASGGTDLTWLRMLRLLKMMKMFRVVRLMRFFKVLRTMISSIAGSLVMLFWAMLMLALMMYMFGLCFVYGCTEYLQDLKPEDLVNATSVESITVDGIRDYYNTVGQSTITLYMAVTGGSDWEPLAAPLKRFSNWLYYAVFLFYIAFSFVSVLNVVTGMFVDAAMKISDQDDNEVREEACDTIEVTNMEEYLRSLDSKGVLTEEMLHMCLDAQPMPDPVAAFMRRIEVRKYEMEQVFHRFEEGGKVDVEVFIDGCLRAKGDNKFIDIVALERNMKRQKVQLKVLSEFMEEHLTNIQEQFARIVGIPPAPIEDLESRMAKRAAEHANHHHGEFLASPK